MSYIDLNDYVPSLKHGAHEKCRWLDNSDHDYLMNKFYEFIKGTGPYLKCDFDDSGYLFDEILDTIDEFIEEVAVTTFGYKYGSLTYIEKQNAADFFVGELKSKLKSENYFSD